MFFTNLVSIFEKSHKKVTLFKEFCLPLQKHQNLTKRGKKSIVFMDACHKS